MWLWLFSTQNYQKVLLTPTRFGMLSMKLGYFSQLQRIVGVHWAHDRLYQYCAFNFQLARPSVGGCTGVVSNMRNFDSGFKYITPVCVLSVWVVIKVSIFSKCGSINGVPANGNVKIVADSCEDEWGTVSHGIMTRGMCWGWRQRVWRHLSLSRILRHMGWCIKEHGRLHSGLDWWRKGFQDE